MKQLTYTIEELKPHLVNLLFDSMQVQRIENDLDKVLGVSIETFPWLTPTVCKIVVGHFDDVKDDDASVERFGELLEEHNDYFKVKDGERPFRLDNSEEGQALKKDLEAYIDWLVEIKEKQEASKE